MKKLLPLALAVAIIACQQKAPTADPEAAMAAVTAAADAFHKALKAKNVTDLGNMCTEDALVCGTDPTEVWNKKVYVEYMTAAFKDPAMVIDDYAIDKRDIKVTPDGMSAIVQDQLKIGILTKRSSVRWVFNFVKQGDVWLFNYSSLAVIPTNEDLSKFDKAMEQMK